MKAPEPAAVLEFVRANPACRVDAVAAAVGSTPRITGGVLRVLRFAGRIRSAGPPKRCLYTEGAAVIPTYAEALAFVTAHPGCTVHAAAAALGARPEVTGAVLRVLRDVGQVNSTGGKRGARYTVVR